MEKILVLGATGMAGHTISTYFLKKGYDVYTLSNTPTKIGKNIILDVFDYNSLKDIVDQGNYQLIINCIGLLNETANNNPDKAIYLNAFIPHFLSRITKETKTKVIQMSTDCVFSGRKGGYLENDFKDGETIYDITKSLGELNNSKDLTFRNSIIGPDMNEKGIGLFNWFMKQKGQIQGYTTAMWTGVTTLTLAKAMEAGYKQNLSGLYHLVNNVPISKHDLLELFNNQFERKLIITPVEKVSLDKSLINSRRDFQFVVPSYEEMVKDMYYWIMENKELYSHYFKEDN